jgi:hypothetical protein
MLRTWPGAAHPAFGTGIFLSILLFSAGRATGTASLGEAVAINPWAGQVSLAGDWRFAKGDSLAWASPAYDDGHWRKAPLQRFDREDLLPGRGNAWFRIRLRLEGPVDSGQVLAIAHLPVTPTEVWWDGVLAGRSGKVGAAREEEEIGRGFLAYLPPEKITPGEHLLAIRLSSHHTFTYVSPYLVQIGDAGKMEARRYHESLIMIFLSGIFVFGALFRFLNYLAAGFSRTSVFFSLSVLSAAVYILVNVSPIFLDMGAGGYLASRVAMGLAWYLMICLVPDYFIFAEDFPYRWVPHLLLAGGLVFVVPMALLFIGLVPFHWWSAVYLSSQVYTYVAIGVSVWVVVWALRHRKTGGGIALLGLASLLIGVAFTFAADVFWGWAAGVAAHIVCLARVQSLRIGERLRVHQADQLKAARLEIELLKKNIQPHFLLNSLNSIIAWLEEEPKTAVRLVKALEEELHMLLRISAERTISLAEEIELCKAHLQVMGLRQDKSYAFRFEGGGLDDRIPPMVLHTLVENGITHGYQGRREGVFRLVREEIPGGVRYSLHNDGVPRARREGASASGHGGEGTGLRYVRTRMEEAFPGRWTLESKAVEDGWKVDLEVKA